MDKQASESKEEKIKPDLLQAAILCDNVRIAKRLLGQCDLALLEPPANVDAWLHYAFEWDSWEVLHLFLKNGTDPNQTNRAGWTLLHLAADRDANNADIYQLLEIKNIDIDRKQSESGDTPLHIAAQKNHVDVAQCLLACHATPEIPNILGWTPLHCAMQNGHLEVTQLLLEMKFTTKPIIDVTLASEEAIQLFLMAIAGGNLAVMKLMSHYLDIAHFASNRAFSENAFKNLVVSKRLDQDYLKYKEHKQAMDNILPAMPVSLLDNWSLLHCAVFFNQIHMVKFLLTIRPPENAIEVIELARLLNRDQCVTLIQRAMNKPHPAAASRLRGPHQGVQATNTPAKYNRQNKYGPKFFDRSAQNAENTQSAIDPALQITSLDTRKVDTPTVRY
jgi:ankyrin repeat protein